MHNGDYAVPQPHPHHHIITSASKSAGNLIQRCGSCPNSAGVSRRGSSSESSPAGTNGGTSVLGGSDGGGMGGVYLDCKYQEKYQDFDNVIHSQQGVHSHYDRMPIPIPIVPPPPINLHSEDEVEPAYATVFPNIAPPPPPQAMPYTTDERNIHRRGARRWRKLYRINGHIFQAKRFNRVSLLNLLAEC